MEMERTMEHTIGMRRTLFKIAPPKITKHRDKSVFLHGTQRSMNMLSSISAAMDHMAPA